MLRRISQNYSALVIGAVFAAALMLFFAASRSAKQAETLAGAANQLQILAGGKINETRQALQILSNDMSRRLGGETEQAQSLTPRDFEGLAQGALREMPFVTGLAYFQRVESRAVAEAMTQPHAEAFTRFARNSEAFFLPVRFVARNSGARPGVFPYSGQGGRLPFDLAASEAVQSGLRIAIEDGGLALSPLMASSGSAIVPVQQTPIRGGAKTAIWAFTPVYDNSAATAGRVEALRGVMGALIDVAQLADGAYGLQNALMAGPLGQADLAGLGEEAPRTKRAVIQTDTQALVGIVSEKRGALFGLGLLGLIGPLLAGAAVAWGVTHILDKERRKTYEYRRRYNANRKKIAARDLELAEQEDRFRHLAESTGVIPWAADLQTRTFSYIGPQIEKVTGYPARSWYANGFLMDHIHPDDRREFITEGFRKMKGGDFVTREYRVRSADGRILHIRNMLTLLPAPEGKKPHLAQGYMLDVTEMKTAQNTLSMAREEAEQANRSKSEFLANMSHELRTPLNAVIGFSEVMKDELFGPIGDRYKDYANSIHSSGRHLLDLINDVLDLSKIEAGKIELVEEETDVGLLLSSCRTLLHERASSAGLHIRLEVPKPLPYMIADGRRMKQILLNLMSNAIKFTAPGGRVTLRAEVIEPKGMRIAVSDTGIGMTREEVDVALSQFGQIDSELSRQHDGTGLGLPIAKSLAELHGGSLEIDSKKGAGTSVIMWLPLTRISAQPGQKSA